MERGLVALLSLVILIASLALMRVVWRQLRAGEVRAWRDRWKAVERRRRRRVARAVRRGRAVEDPRDAALAVALADATRRHVRVLHGGGAGWLFAALLVGVALLRVLEGSLAAIVFVVFEGVLLLALWPLGRRMRTRLGRARAANQALVDAGLAAPADQGERERSTASANQAESPV
jgi:hypothetical protein